MTEETRAVGQVLEGRRRCQCLFGNRIDMTSKRTRHPAGSVRRAYPIMEPGILTWEPWKPFLRASPAKRAMSLPVP